MADPDVAVRTGLCGLALAAVAAHYGVLGAPDGPVAVALAALCAAGGWGPRMGSGGAWAPLLVGRWVAGIVVESPVRNNLRPPRCLSSSGMTSALWGWA